MVPVLLLISEGLLIFILIINSLSLLSLSILIVTVIASIAGQTALFEHQYPGSQSVNQTAVMGYYQQGSVKLAEHILNHQAALHIHMISGLVQ